MAFDLETKTAKQGQILAVARELFWKHGIKRVSVEEICRTAGVSKMTFYRYYPNKKELAKEAISFILQNAMKDYRTLMAREIPFHEKMEELIRLKFEGVKEVSEELIQDIYLNADADLKAIYEQEATKIMQEFVANLVVAQQKGEIRADIQPAFILYMMEKMRDPFFDEQLRSMYDSTADLAVELNRFFFYGLGVRE